MYIQQVRQERKQVPDKDGRMRTVVEVVPEVHADNLRHGGDTYRSHGNGVFQVPDELGAELVGGLFRDVGSIEGDVRAKPVRLTAPTIDPDLAQQYAEAVGGPVGLPEPGDIVGGVVPPEEPPAPAKRARKARKAPAKKAAAKKAAAKK